MARNPQRVLVVEDDPGVAVLQRRRLERAGYQVLVATDVDSALARLAESPVDLIVVDYRLEGSTGLDLHRRLKAAGVGAPVILVSGSMTDAAVIEALRTGVRDVIVKTTDYLDYLPEAVRGVLAQSAAPPAPALSSLKSGRVLVVEDDPGVAALEQRRLERAGYDVVVARDPAEAVAAVQTGAIHLAVLDLRLPGGASGLELYQRLKEMGWNLPAIMVTAFADQTIAIKALRAGIRDFVPKSDDYLDHLPAAVDRVFDQMRIERKLVESELRLASIVGTTMDAIVMTDASGRIALFNQSAEEMFGCPAAAAVGGPIAPFIPELDLEAVGAPGELRRRLEVRAVRSDGSTRPIEVSVSDMVVNGERLFTIMARDITERRRIEAELREADRRKDEFLGMLAHELRNPLAAVMTAGDVLQRQVEDPQAQNLIGVVRRQARTLARMVDDLLDVSRVTQGKITLTTEPIQLGDIVQHAAEHVRSAAESAGLTLVVRVPPQPVRLVGDATRIEQVLVNLLNNAIKFTPPRGRISVELSAAAAHAVIRVTDTGIGIEPDVLPRVFDLFVQADTSLARSQSGLGIGLALVRQLVALHGGRVEGFSAGRGRGSEFVVWLPLAEGEARDEPAAAASASPAVPRRLQALVIDDHPDNADLVTLLVQTSGHEARAAYGGEAGMALARAVRPDIVFVDIGMPGMSGYDVAQAVRADPDLSGVHLVALTGYGREEDRARARAAGFDTHLTKPVDESRLQAVLQAVSGDVPTQ